MQSKTAYTQDTVSITTFSSCDEKIKQDFRSWALSLKPELDGGEYGADDAGEPLPQSAYLWVLKQDAESKSEQDQKLYQTYIFLDKSTGELLATGSIVKDDRNMAAKYEIKGLGFWGFICVRRELKGKGLGTFVSKFMDKQVQNYVNETGSEANLSLFTANSIAVRIYTNLGFQFVQQIYIEEFEATEDLYTKTYTPQ